MDTTSKTHRRLRVASISRSRLSRPLILLIAGAASLAVGACSESAKIERRCDDYCAQAKLCKKDLNEQKCIDGCVDAVESCMAEEQETALQQIDSCANESCDDFVGCSIDAGAQCYFGL